ncbi:MAG TPA: TIGR03435 family protein [Edaphobacter sp.]|nr:TIGR03435 family protein [Edaphobacter sp.]
MTECITRRVGFNKTLLLNVTRGVAIAVIIVFGVGNTIPLVAQSQPNDVESFKPAFEVASIRPDDPDSMANMVRMMFESDRYTASHTTLEMLIKDAYGVDDNQILGAPKWVNSARYDVDAKIDDITVDELHNLSQDQRKLAHQQMLRELLADRFKLTLHRETRERSVYSLVIAKNGPKLQQSKPSDTYSNGLKDPSGNLVGPHMMLMQLGGGQIGGQGVPIELLVKQLSAQLGRTVLNRTGLTGNFDFSLKWTPNTSRPPMSETTESVHEESDNNAVSEPGPSIFAALQEQLGLKLESTKGPTEILVIDHAETPSEN